MKTRRFLGFLIALLVVHSCSSGKPAESSASTTSTPPTIKAITVGSKSKTDPETAALFEKICKSYFQFMKNALDNQIEGKEKDFATTLQTSINTFAKDFSKLDIDSKNLLKNGECNALATLAVAFQNSKWPEYFDKTKAQQPWRADDQTTFDSLSFAMEELLGYYMNSLDHFSNFSGYYNEVFMGEGPYDWQIQFLNRSDYFQYVQSMESRDKNRKPNYLYVQFAPKYISKDLPAHTRIYKVNDIPVNEHFYGDMTKELSRSKVLKLDVKKPLSNGAYSEMSTVTLVYQSVPVTHQIIFETLQEKPYKIGYLKIPEFMNDQASENLLQALDPKNNSSFDGLIIDLRNNPGGSTKIVSQMIGSFFKDDVPTSYLLDAKGNKKIEKSNDTYNPVNSYGRVILLTDFQTASAAETMAATLRDFSGALITGQTTFEKGIGQVYTPNITVAPNLRGDSTTTNFYLFSASGKSWYLKGIQPDIELFEPGQENIQKRLKDLPAGTFPKPYKEQIDVDFDPNNVEMISQKVTNDTRAKLSAYYNAAPENEKKCSTMDLAVEENSCMLNWSFKILQKWIELDRSAVTAK